MQRGDGDERTRGREDESWKRHLMTGLLRPAQQKVNEVFFDMEPTNSSKIEVNNKDSVSYIKA